MPLAHSHCCNNFNAATAASFNRPRVAITGTRY
jgi:hypothetical protein